MINFDKLERDIDLQADKFRSAVPFEYLIVDDFCDENKINILYDQVPDPIEQGINRSRDYIFAKNKYEKSGFKDISPIFSELYADLMSERFQNWLQSITSQPVFVDPAFHGGGIHQGGAGSYLDMHADFNTHPEHPDWFRNLNILLYLNPGWDSSYKGQLKLRHKDFPDNTYLIEPLFNRCVVMFTRDYTVHGYDKISFPEGKFRRSIAAYAYSLLGSATPDHRSTVWYPDSAGVVKSTVGRLWPDLVKVKGKIFGSSTSNNK